jgi:HPt (histidine-containing phosphotransfer) domain-containing protein
MATSTAVPNNPDVPSLSEPFHERQRPNPCAIDLVHLSRQTMGDRGLETELLRLFAHQCAHIVDKLERVGANRRAARDLAHTLKGSARAVGAHAVAAAAQIFEQDIDSDGAEAAALLPPLRAATRDAQLQVLRLLGEN